MNVLYLSQSKLNYSVNAVYIKGLRQNGVTVKTCQLPNGFKKFYEAVKYCRQNLKDTELIMVGYDSPGVAVLMKLICRKKVIYNALCSMYERLIVSRKLAAIFSLKALYYWFLDFAAVHFADLTMLETDNQMEYFNRIFKISPRKLFRAWTGVEDDIFYAFNPAIPKYADFTAVFRGRLLPEAGADIAVRAAKLLEDEGVKFKLIGDGLESAKIERLIKEINPQNLEWIKEFLPGNELMTIMQKSHLSLGQLSGHQRLERTIPHKAYESLAMGIPYLSADNKGIRELLKDGETCILCNAGDEKDLADKILQAKKNKDKLDQIAKNGLTFYKTNLISKNLAVLLLERLREI